MQRDQIRNTLKTILENEIGEVVPNLPDDAKIIEQFGLDSVDVVSLADAHRTTISGFASPTEELPSIDSIGKLLDLIEAKTAALAASADGNPRREPPDLLRDFTHSLRQCAAGGFRRDFLPRCWLST